MALPSFLESAADGTRIRLKVQPRAARTGFAGVAGDELRLRVTAPPVDAAANEAVLEFLAETLGCRRGSVQLLRGQTSRHKIVAVTGLDAETVRSRLPAA
jgi:uncharacterized protein (TIGR00251 family)